MEFSCIGDLRTVVALQLSDRLVHQVVLVLQMHAPLIDGDPDRPPSVVDNARSRWTNTDDGCNDLHARTVSMSLQSLEPSRLVNHVVVAVGDVSSLNKIGSDISGLIWNEWPSTNLMMEWPSSRKLA